MVSLFAEVKIFRFWPKTMVWFSESKKVLRKVCHLIGNEKRNLMTLVSAAQHLPVESYERLKNFAHCTF